MMPESSAQLPKPISVLKPPLVAGGGIFILISFITLLWALFARVPEKVYGTGALLPVDSSQEAKSLIQGTVVYPIIRNKNGFVYRKNLWGEGLYDFVKSPSSFTDDQILELAQFLSDETESYKSSMRANLYNFSGGDDFGAQNIVTVSEGDVLARVENDVMQRKLQESVLLISDTSKMHNQLISKKNRLLVDQNQLLQSRESMVEPIRRLQKKGYTSKVEALRAEADALNERISIVSTESAINELDLKLEQLKSDLRKGLYAYIQQSFIFAYDKAIIKSFRVPQWAFVSPGQSILQLGCDCIDEEYIVPVAVDQVTATRIAPGMKTILTPLGLNPSEVGGIKGQIVALASDPVDLPTLSLRLGSPGLATLLEEQHHVSYLAYVKLLTNETTHLKANPLSDSSDESNNRGIFKWNNRSNPPVKPRVGILLSAQITTRNRTPIEMIIPSINEFFGNTTPYELIEKERG